MRLLVAFALATALAGTPPGALDRTRALVDDFIAVRVAPEGETLDATAVAANEALYRKLDALFDLDALVAASISPHLHRLTTAEAARVTKLFRSIIRREAYRAAGKAFDGPACEIREGEEGAIDVRRSCDPTSTDPVITFFWQTRTDGARVVDVAFDGDSLVKDYQNQFGRILDKEGGTGLIRRLEERAGKGP
jgi:ABC-type transporter MlaC component